MKKIFLGLLSIGILHILLVAGGIYGLSSAQLQQAANQATQARAEAIALSLSKQLSLLQDQVDALAQSQAVIDGFTRADPNELRQIALGLEKILPGALKIRLVIPGSQVVDNDVPLMGFADRDLVKESLITNQLPAVHDQDVNKHLALVARTLKNNLAIGVVLASVDPTILTKSIQAVNLNNEYLSLMQGPLMLMERGDSALKVNEGNKITIPNTRWEVYFWSPDALDASFQSLLAVVVLVGMVLFSLCCFFGFRYVDGLLVKDFATLLRVAKDLLNGKANGNYPVSFSEMRTMISTLVQYRRVLDDDGHEKSSSMLNSAKLNDFFEESEGLSFQKTALSSGGMQDSTKEMPGQPIKFENYFEPPKAPVEMANNAGNTTLNSSRSSIFKPFGIYGQVDLTLTKDIVFELGRALGSEAKAQQIERIIMGYDGRASSPVLAEALAKGIIATGVNVLDIGRVPTPLVYFVAHHSEGRSGVMITGDHHPAQYNGFIMQFNDKLLIEDSIKQLKRRIDNEDFVSADLGTLERNSRYVNEYIGVLSEEIHIVRPMKIVLDCGNGVTSELAPKLFKTLGCEIIELFCDIDGNYPNHSPDPSRAENYSDLSAAVLHYQADLGIVLDGDGDRLGVVDSKGKIILPDRLMMLFAKDVLDGRIGAQIVHDVGSSKLLDAQIQKFGGRSVPSSSVGPLLRAKLVENSAKLAGGMGGHFIINDRWFDFEDALYASARLIQILSGDPRNSAELFASFPDGINTPEFTVDMPDEESQKLLEILKNDLQIKGAKLNDMEGLRLDFADGWGIVRADYLSSALKFRFEADNREALAKIQTQFKNVLLRIKPELNLPF